MKTLHLAILGFNFLVVLATFLIWYYFTDFDVEIMMSPSAPNNRTNGVNENYISKFSWMADEMYKYGGIGKICTPNIKIGCDYQIPPMKVYQINSVVETLRLTNINPNPPFNVYSGWFKYYERYYAISLHTDVYYIDYIFYGVTSSVTGTLVIILIWKKLQNRKMWAIRDSTDS